MASENPAPRRTSRLRRVVQVGIFAVLVGVLFVSGVGLYLTGPEPLPAVPAAAALTTPVLSTRRAAGFIGAQLREAQLKVRLDQFMTTQPPDTCLVVRTQSGATIYDHRGGDLQSPASAVKLLIGVSALLTLGDEFRFKTVLSGPAPGPDGVIQGNVYLVGAGDPTLSTPEYAARYPAAAGTYTDITDLIRDLAGAGVKQVTGSVVVDESRFDSQRYNPLWPSRFISQNQTGPASAASLNDGFATFPTSGNFPVSPAADPPLEAANVFTNQMKAAGIDVVGAPGVGTVPSDMSVLAEVESPRLVDLVSEMLAESDNSSAEHILKELGASQGSTGTSQAGAKVVVDQLHKHGLAIEPDRLVDGSGLAVEDRLTCGELTDVLAVEETRDEIFAGLAVSGTSGTLKGRWLDTNMVGKVRAKTGSLSQASALAGFVTDASGESLHFAYVANVDAPEVIHKEHVAAQLEMVSAIFDFGQPVDLTPYQPLEVTP